MKTSGRRIKELPKKKKKKKWRLPELVRDKRRNKGGASLSGKLGGAGGGLSEEQRSVCVRAAPFICGCK